MSENSKRKLHGEKLEMQVFTLVTRPYKATSKGQSPFTFHFLLKSAFLRKHLAHCQNTRGGFRKTCTWLSPLGQEHVIFTESKNMQLVNLWRHTAVMLHHSDNSHYCFHCFTPLQPYFTFDAKAQQKTFTEKFKLGREESWSHIE